MLKYLKVETPAVFAPLQRNFTLVPPESLPGRTDTTTTPTTIGVLPATEIPRICQLFLYGFDQDNFDWKVHQSGWTAEVETSMSNVIPTNVLPW